MMMTRSVKTVPSNKVIQDRLKQIKRRINWLESRISVYSGKSPSYDQAELTALKWLLDVYENGERIKVKGIEYVPPKPREERK